MNGFIKDRPKFMDYRAGFWRSFSSRKIICPSVVRVNKSSLLLQFFNFQESSGPHISGSKNRIYSYFSTPHPHPPCQPTHPKVHLLPPTHFNSPTTSQPTLPVCTLPFLISRSLKEVFSFLSAQKKAIQV